MKHLPNIITRTIRRVALPRSNPNVNTIRKPDVKTIRHDLGKLPEELVMMIYVAVFTADDQVRNLARSRSNSKTICKDLELLHVTRHSRALYAATYYGHGSQFQFDTIRVFSGNSIDFNFQSLSVRKWLLVLPEAHRALLHQVLLPISSSWVIRRKMELMGREIWDRKRHMSQGTAIASNALYREISKAERAKEWFYREIVKAERAKEWQPLLQPGIREWARLIFLDGIQSFT